jgi:hypothetical protein
VLRRRKQASRGGRGYGRTDEAGGGGRHVDRRLCGGLRVFVCSNMAACMCIYSGLVWLCEVREPRAPIRQMAWKDNVRFSTAQLDHPRDARYLCSAKKVVSSSARCSTSCHASTWHYCRLQLIVLPFILVLYILLC